MKKWILSIAVLTMPATLWAVTPNFSDARWQTVALSMFGQNGIKIDKLTGEAWYLDKVNKEGKWVSIPSPMTKAGLKSMSYGENFQVESAGLNVYLIGLRGGDSWRLADDNGKPLWRRIQ